MKKLRAWGPVVCALVLYGCATQTPPQEAAPPQAPAEPQTSPSVLIDIRTYPKLNCDPKARDRRTVRVRHIVVEPLVYDTEEQWRKAYNQVYEARLALSRGVSFEAVEKQFARGNSRGLKGGELGWFERGVMVPAFEKAAFCLAVKEYSPIIPSEFGFHIMQVMEAKY